MVKIVHGAIRAGAALVALAIALPAFAQETVKIGAVYPLSGNSASTGNYAKMAFEMGADIINNGNPELAKIFPLAKGGGLPGLKGAKIQMVIADNQGTPAAGQNQTLRLITEEKVAALICCYQSGITLTASAVAERYGVPFLNAESVAANLTERGFKWFFRTTPVAADFAKAYSTFLKEQQAAGRKVDSIALVHENTEYGNSVSSVISDAFKKDGLNITMNVAYSANSTDVQPQVLQLKEKNPDVVIFVSYTSDAILYAKTMKEVNWKPAILIADDGGFNDPAFTKAMGSVTEGLISRSVFAPGKPGSVPAILDALYKKKTGGDGLDDVSARVLQGFFVVADAINRAGSTDPAKIRDALKATDLKPDQLVAGYDGVKFDDKGQNVLASTLVTQLRNSQYVSVWPKARATDPLVLPYKGW
ncbi:branched-chain amino acid transport system substrate-binding protein [Enhydrobacter aerosaccus]|uniref:Branched-chain amino acid transport system substrate-binding protein n=1 Tax=Enhydrobacter aerosaccus TaxID=225324 RepID=A0A1T4P2N7_9HYPH|nr:ABC transporter substrate-binding protein [Enhydrobacter aerosaccus]SJZ85651.1 branched-chain amino acid transport system substrate-binding protein [Enhydrobacter aerosaccus]